MSDEEKCPLCGYVGPTVKLVPGVASVDRMCGVCFSKWAAGFAK